MKLPKNLISRRLTPIHVNIGASRSYIDNAISGIAQYSKQTFTSNINDQSIIFDFWSVGGFLFRSFSLNEQYSIQPSFSLFFIQPITTDNLSSADNKVKSVGISVPIVSKLENKRLIIKPAIAFTEGKTSFSLSFEYVGITSAK